MKMPPDVEELVSELEKTYPRAANNIRMFWGADQECKDFITGMLSHTTGKTPQGFTPEALKLIAAIQDRYEQQLDNFETLNKSKDELAQRAIAKSNVWERPGVKR